MSESTSARAESLAQTLRGRGYSATAVNSTVQVPKEELPLASDLTEQLCRQGFRADRGPLGTVRYVHKSQGNGAEPDGGRLVADGGLPLCWQCDSLAVSVEFVAGWNGNGLEEPVCETHSSGGEYVVEEL